MTKSVAMWTGSGMRFNYNHYFYHIITLLPGRTGCQSGDEPGVLRTPEEDELDNYWHHHWVHCGGCLGHWAGSILCIQEEVFTSFYKRLLRRKLIDM